MSNRDRNHLSASAHRQATTTPAPVPDSELSASVNESDSNSEMGSNSALTHPMRCNFSVHFPGSGLKISVPEEVVTSSSNRSTFRTQVPSPSFHQPSVSSPPSTPPPSYRSGGSSGCSTPPPSYQEVMQGGHTETPATYQATVLHTEHYSSSNEGP